MTSARNIHCERRLGADLHVHTTHSDGTFSPGEVVRSAASVGLSAIAITDHDTLSALKVARPEAERLAVELIGGIELTAEMEGRELHILGHFVSDEDPELRGVTDDLRHARRVRIEAMVDRLRRLGLRVDLEAVSRLFPRATLGRRHLADWLVQTRQVGDRREVFARFLGEAGPAQVPKPRLPWERAIHLIRTAGGVAGLAHPPYDLRLKRLEILMSGGLGAIEVAGPGVTNRLERRWRDWAKILGLVPIAGSDFHAPDRPGQWVESTTTPPDALGQLRARRDPL